MRLLTSPGRMLAPKFWASSDVMGPNLSFTNEEAEVPEGGICLKIMQEALTENARKETLFLFPFPRTAGVLVP